MNVPCADKMRNRKLHRTDKYNEKGQEKMRRSRNAKRQIAASILTGVFILHQSMTLSASAAIKLDTSFGNNGSQNNYSNNIINPGKTTGNIGFQKYTEFNLGSGETANLNFNNIDTFVNLMESGQFRVDGILNTVRGNNLYDGKAVFISPGGMIVGASGVLNVGSLSVNTLNSKYIGLIENGSLDVDTAEEISHQDGSITVNGKIMATNDINLRAQDITIGSTGGLVAGIANNAGDRTVYNATNKIAADALFNNLVNTNNITSNSSYKNSTGKGIINIRNSIMYQNPDGTSHTSNATGSINVAGKVVNYATVTQQEQYDSGIADIANITVYNDGGNGLDISGTIVSNGGIVHLQTARGDINIAQSANIKNTGTLYVINRPVIPGSAGQSDDEFNDTTMTISGTITNNGNLVIQNQGYGGLNITSSAKISNTGGNTTVINGNPGSGNIIIDNTKVDDLTISGTISNSGGKVKILWL